VRDVERTVISQYSNSTRLCALISHVNDYLDPQANLQRFYDLVWNVDTAEGYGLDVWGRIVGIGRVVWVPAGLYFGFKEALPGIKTFGFGPFYDDQPLTVPYTLDDEAYRRVIMAKAATNITNGSIPAINAILMTLFPGRGNAYAQEVANQEFAYFGFAEQGGAHGFDGLGAFGDYLDLPSAQMRIVYKFEFELEPFEHAIVRYSGAVPKPAGVKIDVQFRTRRPPTGIFDTVGTAAGVGGAHGAPDDAPTTGTAAGSGAAAGVSSAISEMTGAASGSGSAAGVGAANAAGAGAATGSGDAAGESESSAEASGAASGIGDAAGIGETTAEAEGVAAGIGSADGVGSTV